MTSSATAGEPSVHTAARTGRVASATAGEQSVHTAARTGRVDVSRLLLQQTNFIPNAVDSRGRTILMVACDSRYPCVDVVRVMLLTGVDPTLAEENGYTALHVAAANGHTDLVDILYSQAPATLNVYSARGQTPLYVASLLGRESMVSKLLSLNAKQIRPPEHRRCTCPLVVAVVLGFAGVVRVLISERGLSAVGGEGALRRALHAAVIHRKAIILRLLLTVGGEDRRSRLANFKYEGTPLLQIAAVLCYRAAVSILLEAGADEAAHDPKQATPAYIIGECLPWMGVVRTNPHPMNPKAKTTISRMLNQGPAFRATSWGWPADAEVDTLRSGNGDGGSDVVAPAVVMPTTASTTDAVVGVRIDWPDENQSGRVVFMSRVVRWAPSLLHWFFALALFSLLFRLPEVCIIYQ